MKYVIETHNLKKNYGKKTILNDVSIHVKSGEIYGLIGENGAGKTTIMKIISKLSRASSGLVNISDVNGREAKISCLIESPGLYYNMTAYQNIKCKCILEGIRNTEYIKKYLKLVSLENTGNKKVRDFSLGMKQRLGVALSLIGEPDIIILDEPINGLDPQGISEMRELIRKLNCEQGITFLISSHILSELSKIADTIGIIHCGKLMEEISVDELNKKCADYIEIETFDVNRVKESLEKINVKNVEIVDARNVRVYGYTDNTVKINKHIIKDGCSIIQSKIIRMELESYFLELTRDGDKND